MESIFSHVTEYWVDVTAGGEKITATRGHRFWVESLKKWVSAQELKAGMKLLGSSGRIVLVTEVHIRHLPADEITYNFFVADTHVYFVGKQHWLVHNGDNDSPPPPPKQVYPVKPQYPPPTKVGENFQFNFDTSTNMQNSRAAGVRRAQQAGTIDPGEIGHHINSVQSHPDMAAEPDNIKGVSSTQEHLNEHGGDFKNSTSGSLKPGKC